MFPVSFAVATLGTHEESGTESGDGLTQHLWSYDLYLGNGEPRQQPAFRRLLFLSRATWLGLFLPQGVTCAFPVVMFFPWLRCFFGKCRTTTLKLAFMFHTPKRVINHLYGGIVSRYCVDTMKAKGLHIRISERRLNKLRLYAASKEKTMTQLIEDWVDRLPLSEGMETSVPPVSR